MAVTVVLGEHRITLSAVNDQYDHPVVPAFFRFLGVTGDDHTCVLTELSTGNPVFQGVGVVGGVDMQPSTRKAPIQGVKLTAITSGRVEIILA